MPLLSPQTLLSLLGGSSLGALGLGHLWAYLKLRERVRIRLDGNVLTRENALWHEIGELKAQVSALGVKMAADTIIRDWLVEELSGCRLSLLLTMDEVNAERAAREQPQRYDLRVEAQALRQRVPPRGNVGSPVGGETEKM